MEEVVSARDALVELDLDQLRAGLRTMLAGHMFVLNDGELYDANVLNVSVNGVVRSANIRHFTSDGRWISMAVLCVTGMGLVETFYVVEAQDIMDESCDVRVRQVEYVSNEHGDDLYITPLGFAPSLKP